MRALVLDGAGAVCRETTRDLAKYMVFLVITLLERYGAVNRLTSKMWLSLCR